MSKSPQDKWNDGLEVLEAVYGPGTSSMMKGQENWPMTVEVISHQFGDVWANPSLSIRDKRLMVLGATAMLGRADLIEVQVAGAIINGEFTEEQLGFIPLFLMFYAGAPNCTALLRGIEAAKVRAKALLSAQQNS